MVKVFPEPVTPSRTCVRSFRLHAFDQVGNRRRLVALRIEIGLDDEALAAFGFIRPRRPVRRPQLLVAELFAALAQQTIERLLARHAAECADTGRLIAVLRAPREAPMGRCIAVLDHTRCGVIFRLFNPQRLRQIGVEFAGATGVLPT